jgi:putative endonuclease
VFYTYILQSQKSGRHYIGSTQDLKTRIIFHNKGKNPSTKNKGPWELVFSKTFETRAQAMQFEKKIKSFKGGNKFKELLNTNGSVD